MKSTARYISSPVMHKGNISVVFLYCLCPNLFLMSQLNFAIQLSHNSPDTCGKLAGDVGEHVTSINVPLYQFVLSSEVPLVHKHLFYHDALQGWNLLYLSLLLRHVRWGGDAGG